MKLLIIIILAWTAQANAASLAICTESKADDGRIYFRIDWWIDIPPDKIKLTRATPDATTPMIIVGGQVQDLNPNMDIAIEFGQDTFSIKVLEAVKAHPQSHIALIQNREIVGMIKSDTKGTPSLLDRIKTGAIRFRTPKWRIRNED